MKSKDKLAIITGGGQRVNKPFLTMKGSKEEMWKLSIRM